MSRLDALEGILRSHVASVNEDLMTGLSYTIPFVTVGGVFLALGYAVVTPDVPTPPVSTGVSDAAGHADGVQWLVARVGAAGLRFAVPVLGAYVAYAVADRPGLAPGFLLSSLIQQRDVLVATATLIGVSVDGVTVNGAGYLGALLTGLLVGHVVRWLTRRSVPDAVDPLLVVFFAPLSATVLLAPVVFVLGVPIAVANAALTASLAALSGVGAVLVGAVLGGMVAFDFGGPINKVAYLFAIGSVTEFVYEPMAAVMVAGMVPPLGLALSHTLAPQKYDAETRAARAVPLGLTFVTEGAIPYATADPLRVVPAAVVGGAVGAAAAMGLGVTMPAPHGGVFVFLLSNRPALFLACLGVGTAVTAALATVLKPDSHDTSEEV